MLDHEKFFEKKIFISNKSQKIDKKYTEKKKKNIKLYSKKTRIKSFYTFLFF